jgi:HEPN domain-containing protein
MKLPKEDVRKWIRHWEFESSDVFKTAEDLYKAKRYHHALFFCHLGVEKKLKALYVSKKESFPPPVHDLLYLLKKIGITTQKETLEDLAEINSFNIRARYDDYKNEFYIKATRDYCHKWLEKAKEIINFLKTI